MKIAVAPNYSDMCAVVLPLSGKGELQRLVEV